MPLIVVTEGTPALEPGSYPATLVAIKPKRLVTQYSKNGEEQDFLEWTWLVEGPDKDIEITSLSTTATGPKSKIVTYLTALVGSAEIGAGFDEKDLVGKKVIVATVVDANGFSKIDNVLAPPKTRQAPANGQPPAAAPVAEAVVEEAAPVAVTPTAEEVSGDDLPF